MAKEKESKKCAHPVCSCAVTEGEKYCSVYCKDAKDYTELSCSCGHPDCR